jgi:hypothetical protein
MEISSLVRVVTIYRLDEFRIQVGNACEISISVSQQMR